MNSETFALASILFSRDRTKPCGVCGDALDEADHDGCRRALWTGIEGKYKERMNEKYMDFID